MLNSTPPSRSVVQDWIVNYITSVLDLSSDDVPVDRPFKEIGMDSAEVVIMTGVMEEEFAFEVQPDQPFEHPTIAGFLDVLVKTGLVSE